MSDKKKPLVIGGTIIDPNGDEHYISPGHLCIVYNIDARNCLVAEDDDDIRLKGLDLSKYEIYRPRQDGNYQRREK